MSEQFDNPNPAEAKSEELTPEEKMALLEPFKGYLAVKEQEDLDDYIVKLREVAEKMQKGAEFEAILFNRLEPAKGLPLGPGTDEKYFKPAGLALGVYNDFRAVALHIETPRKKDDPTA